MKLLSIDGQEYKKNVAKYRIKWDEKSRSKIQFRAKQLLKRIWINDIVYEEFPVFASRMKVDFFNATKFIAVEVNGTQHDKFNPFFHNKSRMNYLHSIKRDYAKAEWLKANNITLIEVIEADINNPEEFYKLVILD
jgi:hypothetical protein